MDTRQFKLVAKEVKESVLIELYDAREKAKAKAHDANDKKSNAIDIGYPIIHTGSVPPRRK